MLVPLTPDAVSAKSPASTPVTGSENVTVKSTLALFEGEAETLVIEAVMGAAVSITKLLFAPSEPVAPGETRVRVALLPAGSLIVPLLRANAVVEAQSR